MRGGIVYLVLLVILLTGCATEKAIIEEKEEPSFEQEETGGEIMGKVLFIIAQNGYQDNELGKPKSILENAGYECKVASITTDTATGALGGRIKPDLAVRDASIDDYDYFKF